MEGVFIPIILSVICWDLFRVIVKFTSIWTAYFKLIDPSLLSVLYHYVELDTKILTAVDEIRGDFCCFIM